ncbi:MAG TPA: hypothetical protein ENL27_01265, partial [Candidatus Parcubacteria bacterium]|nr:hypothetical protein [Candidatus Parcubacteria bacterium]
MKKVNYQKTCSIVLNRLSPRIKDIIERRFGLNGKEKHTLESVGRVYGLTRERIRQIEKDGFLKIKKAKEEFADIYDYFKKVINSFGGYKEENSLLSFLSSESQDFAGIKSKINPDKEKRVKNCILLFLTLSGDFQKISEKDDLRPFWTTDKNCLPLIEQANKKLISFLERRGDVISLEELFKRQKDEISKIINNKKLTKKILESILEISKEIQKSPEGEY